MRSDEYIISLENTPKVALGMTSASFDHAQRQGVAHIEADVDAMTYIARQIGVLPARQSLAPQVLLTRDANDTRKLIGRWDDRLPRNQGEPNTGRFFPANLLHEIDPPSANRESFAWVARAIGAPALTEISVRSWTDTARHAGDYATGLLLGMRPVELPPAPSLLDKALNLVRIEPPQAVKAMKAARADTTLPPPFIVSYLPR